MSTSGAFHHGDLKAALARGAVELLERDGADALSLREVARAIGVSTAAPYRHYASKEALLAEVARQGFLHFHDELAAVEARGDARAAFMAQGVAYVRFAQAHPALYRMMFGGMLDKQRHPALRAAGDQLFALLDARLAAGAGASAPRAVGCWAFVHGLAMLALDGQLDIHLPGDDDATLRAILAPMVDTYMPHPDGSHL